MTEDEASLNGTANIVGKKDKKENLLKQIDELQKKTSDLEHKIKGIKDRATTDSIKEMLDLKQEDLTLKKEAEKDAEANIMKIEREIVGIKNEIEDIEKKTQGKLKEKRNLAIVIKTQWETAKLLREFTDLITSTDKGILSNSNKKDSLLNTCKEFMTFYDQNIHRLEEEWKKDLKVS